LIRIPPGDLSTDLFVTPVPEMREESRQMVLLRLLHSLNLGFYLLNGHAGRIA
jgi:hypothetical protein